MADWLLWDGGRGRVGGRSHEIDRIWPVDDTMAPDQGDEAASLRAGVGGGVSEIPAVP